MNLETIRENIRTKWWPGIIAILLVLAPALDLVNNVITIGERLSWLLFP